MTTHPPILGLTMGDPAGIGPEIVLKAIRDLAPRVAAGEFALTIIGSDTCMRAAAERLGFDPTLIDSAGLIEAAEPRRPIAPGVLDAEAGRLAYEAIAKGVDLAMAGEIDAIVTAPISKEALHLAGFSYPGHTEILAKLSGSSGSCMMLVHDKIRVSHVSTHVALADVPKRMTPERLRYVIDLTHQALLDLGFETPRIGVCALNPHAGENGMFGTEDQDITVPLVAAYRAAGWDVDGPIPGDTIFVKALAGQYHAVIAMYHDQGHIPVKTLGFTMDPTTGQMSALSGVNVTLGLPIVRTSVDHGTAFDIAGKGVANAQSMVEAIEVAAQLVGARGRRAAATPVVRPATLADVDALRVLQVEAMRALGPEHYAPAEVEAALSYICVPDRELIEDGTYVVAEVGGRMVGCGGWSLRRKTYAGPADDQGAADRLDPAIDPTNIRAMFTAPEVTRQGIGRAILAAAEEGARAAGFRRARLGATLSGEAFYRHSGYHETGREAARLPDGTEIAVVLMEKDLAS